MKKLFVVHTSTYSYFLTNNAREARDAEKNGARVSWAYESERDAVTAKIDREIKKARAYAEFKAWEAELEYLGMNGGEVSDADIEKLSALFAKYRAL